MKKEGYNFGVISARKIYEVLDAIFRKPEIWLTTKSISSLQNYLNGYMTLGLEEDVYNIGEPDLNDFKIWIVNKGKVNIGVGNPFSTVLLAECNGDEIAAFDRFFEYLKEFKKNINCKEK